MPKVTIILLNYKRPQNIPIILKAVRSQTVKSTVFLWNNGDADVNSPLIDRYEEVQENIGCMARWKLAMEATTPYVMNLDDDLCFERDDVIESIVRCLDRQTVSDRIIGAFGKIILKEDQTYTDTMGINDLYRKNLLKDTAVDLIKGRIMALNAEALKSKLSLSDLEPFCEDDIIINGLLANRRRRHHLVPFVLRGAFRDLPDYSSGLVSRKDHFERRNATFKKYFG